MLQDQSNQSRITVFYTPRFKKYIHSSCFYLPQVLQFAEQWIGASYPFGSLCLVFSETTHAPIISGATIIIASINLLLESNVIDQVFQTRFTLSNAIAHQWFGHYISPASWDDLWIIIGFSRVLAYQFMKKIHGNNEIKFRIKKDTERLCLIDTKQLPINPANIPKAKYDVLIGNNFSPFEDPSSIRAELVNLKSALVLLMMEKRFCKGLLSKLASKIMMSQMSGELTSGISTIELLKTARKISGKLEVKDFADQWIYGSGCPIFRTSYNFNRKKMVIELKISQRSSNEGMVGGTLKFTASSFLI
jgi:aminopeptidase N